MHCPNCNNPNMRTTETFKTPRKTYRTKKCRVCNWTFTTHEVISNDTVIPASIRNLKRGTKP